MRHSLLICLALLATPAHGAKVFVETEPSTVVRQVISFHAGFQVIPKRTDLYATYMWGSGSRPNDNFFSGGSADFDHQCWGIGLRRSEDTSINGSVQTFNLRSAETEWAASCGPPLHDPSLASSPPHGRRPSADG
ncbi:hypothetical protein H8E52_00090, partial [bacterium]|nr:hypothetical protein [bacterium]